MLEQLCETTMPSVDHNHDSGVHHGEYSYSDISEVVVKGRRHCKLVFTVTTITSLILNVGLIVFLFLHNQTVNNNRDAKQSAALGIEEKLLKNSVCVECRMFGLSRDQALSSKSVWLLSLRDGDLCCLPEAENLWRLLNVYNMKMRMQQLNAAQKTKGLHLPSAHLYLDSLEASDYKWSDEYGFGAAHVIRPIEFRNGAYHILKGGFYNIYSFLTLKRRKESRSPAKIGHFVKKISNRTLTNSRTSVVLQENVELPSQSESFTTSYLSGVVLLQNQDELFVDVSDKSAIYRFAPSNYFGLHLVQDPKNS